MCSHRNANCGFTGVGKTPASKRCHEIGENIQNSIELLTGQIYLKNFTDSGFESALTDTNGKNIILFDELPTMIGTLELDKSKKLGQFLSLANGDGISNNKKIAANVNLQKTHVTVEVGSQISTLVNLFHLKSIGFTGRLSITWPFEWSQLVRHKSGSSSASSKNQSNSPNNAENKEQFEDQPETWDATLQVIATATVHDLVMYVLLFV